MNYEEMTLVELAELTELVDNYNYDKEEIITPIGLYEKWWPRLNQLRQAPNKAKLLAHWKYSKELESVEYSHQHNANTHIQVDQWEQRFVVDFWLCIYH